MAYTFTISAAALKAVALAKGVYDIRYYLNGVLLEVHQDGTFLVATDGHRMHCMRITPVYNDDSAHLPLGAEIIIPDTVVDALKTSKAEGDMLTVTIASDLRSGDMAYGLTFRPQWKAVEGKFPAWRRVLPRGATVGGKGCTINPDYLSDVKKAGKLLGAKDLAACPQIQYDESGTVVRTLLQHAPEFVAVIMAFVHKVDKRPCTLVCPTWAA